MLLMRGQGKLAPDYSALTIDKILTQEQASIFIQKRETHGEL